MFIEPLIEALDRNEPVALATILGATGALLKPGMRLLVKESDALIGSLATHPLAPCIVEDCLAMTR